MTFWTDWGDTCQWTYLRTVARQVLDIPNIPKDGLTYSAIIPVDLSAIQRSCDSPISRVREVLSWDVSVNVDEVPYWRKFLTLTYRFHQGYQGVSHRLLRSAALLLSIPTLRGRN